MKQSQVTKEIASPRKYAGVRNDSWWFWVVNKRFGVNAFRPAVKESSPGTIRVEVRVKHLDEPLLKFKFLVPRCTTLTMNAEPERADQRL